METGLMRRSERSPFGRLVDRLREIFEQDEVDIPVIMDMMEQYQSNEEDWRKYAKFSDHSYTRNLVDSGNEKFNLMALAWNPGQRTCVHNHSSSSCIMKILEGTITELRYGWPSEDGLISPGDQYVRRLNEVAYIDDNIGLHEMMNDSNFRAVSLHLYFPPYDSCYRFDREDGSRSRCAVTYWSMYGMLTPFDALRSNGEEEDMMNVLPCC